MNRILKIDNLSEARMELEKIKVSSQGINVMAPKALGLIIKITGVKVGAANILKQEMLSIGGDAAVARGVVEGKEKISDVVLLGNLHKIKKLIDKLGNQTIFGLPAIRQNLITFSRQLMSSENKTINCRNKKIILDSTKIIGILNVTPDSFSDGNLYIDPEKAVEYAMQMVEDGADIIDIGGESTRPGAEKIPAQTEMERVIPIIKALRKFSDIPISIDTYKASVAEAALENGASIINDISALRFDPEMIDVLKKYENVPVILMHISGTPETMQVDPHYDDTINEIIEFFRERISFCLKNGISKARIIIDPGIGFGKRHKDNLIILKKISEFSCFDIPVLIGASRKSFISRIYKSDVSDRIEGSLAAAAIAIRNKVDFVRVHDVLEHKRFIKVMSEIGRAK